MLMKMDTNCSIPLKMNNFLEEKININKFIGIRICKPRSNIDFILGMCRKVKHEETENFMSVYIQTVSCMLVYIPNGISFSWFWIDVYVSSI